MESIPYLGEVLYYLRYVCLFASVLLIARMIYTYRRIRPVSKKSCIIGIIFPVLILGVYSFFIGSGLPSSVMVFLFLGGLYLGFWRGRKTKLWMEGHGPRVQHTIWFLVIWGISYTLMQALVSMGHWMSISVGIGAMCFSTAVAIGSQGNLLVRLRKLLAIPQSVPAEATPAGLPAASQQTRSRRFCTGCGSEIISGDRFCRNCRAVL